MTPSTENTTQLLEWHPGSDGAATTNARAALAWGARRAWSSKLLICYLWLLYLLVVEGAGGAILSSLRSSASWTTVVSSWVAAAGAASPFSGQVADTGYRAALIDSVARPLWSPTVHFVLFFGLVAGGAVAYVHAPRPAPLLAQLGANCGIYAGRFMRLILIAAAVFCLLTGAASALLSSSGTSSSVWVRVISFQVTIAFWATVVDYARVRTVARDSRSMLLEALRSLRFVIFNLPRILSLEVLIVALTFGVNAVLLASADALRGFVSPTHLALGSEQAYVIAMLWVRLTAWGAMLALYQGIALERLSKTSG